MSFCFRSFLTRIYGFIEPANSYWSSLVGRRLIHLTKGIWKQEESSGGYYEFTGPVPEDRLDVRFARSSGPGGQNVNKVNTKVDVRFHLPTAEWIPDEVRRKLLQREKNRINKSQELVVSSTKYRSQHRNLQDAISKIQLIIKEASYIPQEPSKQQKMHVQKLARRYNDRRLQEKKFMSFKKRDRRTDH